MNQHPFPVIMGPTASGKSALAIAAALGFGGEIISMDSMQVYRGLDIGTAKPSREEQSLVPHHLIDILDLQERADLFTFRDRAEEKIRKSDPAENSRSRLEERVFICELLCMAWTICLPTALSATKSMRSTIPKKGSRSCSRS